MVSKTNATQVGLSSVSTDHREELDVLNQASMDVNRLENELDEARNKYRSTFAAASQRMEELGAKIRKSIQRARQYFELIGKAKEAQSEAVRAARQYQTANGVYRAAKETIALAELRLMDDDSQSASLSSAWQEMLNHATVRVMDAEREKTRSEGEHHKRAAAYADVEAQLHSLEKKYKRSIAKARPYFETKAELELKLQQQKQNVSDLQQAIAISKTRYANALHNLESISEEIHESRRSKLLLMFPREPGVGAESDSVGSSISEANIEKRVFPTSHSFTDSLSTNGGDDDEESGPEGEGDDVFNSNGGQSAPRSRLHSEPSSGANSVFEAETRLSESSAAESVTSSEGLSLSPSYNHKDISFPDAATSSKDLQTSAASCVLNGQTEDAGGDGNGVRSEASGARVAGDGSPTTDVCLERSSSDTLRAATGSTCSLSTFTQDSSDVDSGIASATSDSDLKSKASIAASVGCVSRNNSNSNSPGVDFNGNGRVDPVYPTGYDRTDSEGRATVKVSAGLPRSASEPQVKKLPLRRTDCGRNHRTLQGVMLLNPSDLASTFKF
ncbi:hypothetical protein BaRGS_00000056 [Batillaria attramentaria]|uniref:SH3 domain-binding protein 5 n=1 Tax=Batillaria attramentaria TaxID=370345 RepID=A0ABD0M986_9CAEN